MYLKNYQCPVVDDNTHIISGQWSSVFNTQLALNVKTCKQLAQNQKECGSEVEAEELKKMLVANFIYVENYFDINEFE